MSRLSASEIIDRGDYLQPDFEPSTLTIPHLLSVLTYHGIKYPSPHTKGKLVDVFNNEIKPRSAELLRERQIRERKKPSHEGIFDGHTGRAIQPPEPAPVRRSTRRSSQQPPDVIPPPEPAPVVKRRRSSAGPTMSRSGSRIQRQTRAEPVLAEESESEPTRDKSEDPRPRKTSRTKGPSARERRRSAGLSDNNESAWEDNNVFQSGAEDSSPARPSPARRQPKPRAGPPPVTRRVSNRTSLSAPPQARPITSRSPVPEPAPEPLPDPVIEPQAFQDVPTSSTFTPRIPRTVNVPTGGLRVIDPPASQIRKSIAAAEASAIVDAAESSEEEEEETQKPTNQTAIRDPAPESAEEEAVLDEVEKSVVSEAAEADRSYETVDEPAEYDAAVAKRIAAIGEDAASGKALVRRSDIRPPPIFPTWLSTLIGLSLALFLTTVSNYRLESSSIGWCDTGRNTNSILIEHNAAREARYECAERLFLNPTLDKVGLLESGTGAHVADKQEVIDGLLGGECTPIPLIPLPRPSTCTPCPEHAVCSPPHGITCDPTYILKPHPLAAVPGLRRFASGLPGFGAVAFPPQCVEDDARKRKVTGVAKGMAGFLENIKGDRICAGVNPAGKEIDGGVPRKFGIRVDELFELVLNNIQQRSTTYKEDFESIFKNAMEELEKYGWAERSTDSNGVEWIASKRATMSASCRVKVGTRDAWSEWQMHFYTLIGTILSAVWARSKIASKRRESRRVADLAGVALDLVRNQEIAHHTDPIRAPHTYISSLHLRDMILQDEHNIRERVRLWNKVAKIVEGNANVRANVEEVAGDDTRVWRWVGTSRAIVDLL
ncbi:inner nuclear membrane protein enriched at telomere/subtelomere region [Ceratobasidium sp. 392]|nr:inner nuclear membrane protein enriched at telomere/subtelomere region [Ceratobasidium sp. 392]